VRERRLFKEPTVAHKKEQVEYKVERDVSKVEECREHSPDLGIIERTLEAEIQLEGRHHLTLHCETCEHGAD